MQNVGKPACTYECHARISQILQRGFSKNFSHKFNEQKMGTWNNCILLDSFFTWSHLFCYNRHNISFLWKIRRKTRRHFNSVIITHLLILVSINGSISDSASEARSPPRRSDLSSRVGVLSGQPEVQHVNVPHGLRRASNSKIGRLNVSVKEAHVVNGLCKITYIAAFKTKE